jgi:DNA repair protein RadC
MKSVNLYELKKIQTNFPVEKITSSKNSSNFIKQFYGDDIDIFESCFILLLNNSNNTIGYAKISQGGITGTVVDIRLIAKYAVESLATGVILAHNHPSGTLSPSQADINITDKTKKALETLDIKLLDHLILTNDDYYSLSDNGKM